MTGTIGERVRTRMTAVLGDTTQSDLAAAVSMTPDAFSRALNGQRSFATLELVRLANVLRTSMHWLATGEEDPNATRVAARHTFDHALMAHEPVNWTAERSAIETVSTAYTQVFTDAPAYREASRAVPSAPSSARAELLAHDHDFVRNFAASVEAVYGIDVVRISEAERPYSVEAAGRRVIVVQPHVNWFYQNWSIAHEIGHFASGNLEPVGSATAAGDTSNTEIGANAFAGELLLPAEEMRQIDWQRISPSALADLLWSFGVSTHTLRVRLSALGIIPSEGLRELLSMSTQRVLRRHWTDDGDLGVDSITDRMERANTRRFPAALLSAHTEAVSSGLLSAAYLAWMLAADEQELIQELAPATNEVDLDWLADSLGLES